MSETAKSLKVLVVEDESIIRLDIVESLSELGYEIVGQGADGLQAISLAEQLQPDLIVMDVKMPNLDGLSATEKISELKIPVVLLTAFSQKELIERASEAGAMAYLIKPFNPDQLRAAVEIAFSRNMQLRLLEAEITDLNERFEVRKIIDRAKGLLNKHAQMSEPEAFRWIQKQSMDKRVSMEDVASKVIEKFTSGE
jgi:response regulator NasT